jgi:peptidoglycan/xylan/chitin deacetylase (PgdA/CDA1 family)
LRVLSKLKRGVERATSYLSGRVLILLYHRVAEPESDPWELAVSPQHLEEHLQFLSKYYGLMSMRDLSEVVQKGRLPRRRVVVTFDDGYADNLLTAKPLLEKYDVPATVFIATGNAGQDREFWWDELDRLLMKPGALPGTLTLAVNGDNRYWELGDGARYDQNSHQHELQWRASEVDAPAPRRAVYRSLWEWMQTMPEDSRLLVRQDLLEWAGASGGARETHRVLAREEIVELTRGGLVDVGCHTVTHPKLSALDAEAQWNELVQSKRSLEGIVGSPVSGFAYPYGRDCDYTSETVRLVREAGFDYACTTSGRFVERGVDRFQLPRVAVRDLDGDAFARLISERLQQ